MTRLEDLLYSLATVIVRYHDSQLKLGKLIVESDKHLGKVKSRACAVEIIQGKEIDYITRLNTVIFNCTKKINYTEREPLLHFLLHEIIFLKSPCYFSPLFAAHCFIKMKETLV